MRNLYLIDDLDQNIDYLINNPKDINISIDHYRNIMFNAISRERIDIVSDLLELGYNKNLQDTFGNTALHICCRKNINKDILYLLIEYGSTGNFNIQTQDGYTPLHYAAIFSRDPDIIRILAHVSNPDIKNRCGNTPLNLSCMNNNIYIIHELLKITKTINNKDKLGNTALHWLCKRNEYNSIRLLLEFGCKGNISNIDNETPYDLSDKEGKIIIDSEYNIIKLSSTKSTRQCILM